MQNELQGELHYKIGHYLKNLVFIVRMRANSTVDHDVALQFPQKYFIIVYMMLAM